jgi:hypothetical protein
MSNANGKAAPPYTILRETPSPKGGVNLHVRLRGGRKMVVSVPVYQNNPEGKAAAIAAAAAAEYRAPAPGT